MRKLLALLIVVALARSARAQEGGPDEPRPTEQPAPTTPPATTPPAATTPTTPPDGTAPPAATTPPSMAMPVGAPSGKKEVEEIEPNPPKKYAIIFGGAAGTCLLLGGILGGVAMARASEQSGDASNPPVYTKDLQSRAGEGQSMANAAYAFFGLGAALAIVDAVLWFETLRKPKVIKRTIASSTGPRFFPLGVRF